MGDMNIIEVAAAAVRMYAETHPRPASVTQKQACDMLNKSHVTVSKLVKAGKLKLNDLGEIPITEIDRVLEARI